MIGPKLSDQKELRILNRTLRWCKDGSVFAANMRHGREVVDVMGLSKSKPVSSPATGDGATRCRGDELRPLCEEEKRLYQRIVAKLNYRAHDRLDLKVCNFMSCKCCLVAFLWRHASSETSWALLEESTRCLTAGELLCHTDAELGLRQDFSEIKQWGCRDSWWLESELFAAITSGTRS